MTRLDENQEAEEEEEEGDESHIQSSTSIDHISLISLFTPQRHATATLAQVGTPKVTSCAETFKSIAPWVEVDARIALFGIENADELLDGNPDFVIDCIDNIDSKVKFFFLSFSLLLASY